jgi:hypothetical protein
VIRFGPKPSECHIVVVILWSRLGSNLDVAAFKKPGCKPYLSGTEWEFEDAINASPRPEIFVYRRMEDYRINVKDPNWTEKRRQYELVEQFFENFKNPDGSFRRGWTPYDAPTDFKTRFANDLKSILRERLKETSTEAVTSWAGSPHPGLRPFTNEESTIFFGRGREVDGLIARLRDPSRRFLAVVGASGSGKSSLIRAGLLPRLADGAIEGSEDWRVVSFTLGAVGGDPFLAMAAGLSTMLPAQTQQPPIRIANALEQSPSRLLAYVDMLLAVQ